MLRVMAFTLVEETNRATVGSGSSTATRVFQCRPFASYPQVLGGFLSQLFLRNGRILRTRPARHPYLTWLWADSVEVEGVGAFGDAPYYTTAAAANAALNTFSDHAKLTVTYKSFDPSIADLPETPEGGDDRTPEQEIELATHSWDFGSKNLTLPNSFYKTQYTKGPVSLAQGGQQASKTIPTVQYSVTRHFQMNLPWDAINKLQGRVNKDPFQLGKKDRKFTFGAETIRFDGANYRQKVSTEGIPFFDVTLKFAIMPLYDYVANQNGSRDATDPRVITGLAPSDIDWVGWNRVYVPDMACWDRIYHASDAGPNLTTGRNLPFGYDSLISQNIGTGGAAVKGFQLLFHPAAT